MATLPLRGLRVVAALALLFIAIIPEIASAQPLSPPTASAGTSAQASSPTGPVALVFEGTSGQGHGPANPLAIVGTVRNTLAPGQSVWYETSYGGAPPLGVTVDYNPPNGPAPGTVQMHVDWTTPNGSPDADLPGYYRVGEGTTSGLGQGALYWQTSVNPDSHYLVEIVNNSTVPIGYAIAQTNQQFPPPELNPAPPRFA